MRGGGMYQRANDFLGKYLRNYFRRWGEHGDSVVCGGRGLPRGRCQRKSLRATYLAGLVLLAVTVQRIAAQEKSPGPVKGIDIAAKLQVPPQTPAPAGRSI